MKKNLISILLFVMIMPFYVNAKEYCKVVSGNGKDIGSEIACGTEHFNIIETNDEEIKLLAKYNLYTGVSIDKIEIEKEAGDTRTDEEYCQALAQEKGGTSRRDGVYNVNGVCFIEKNIITDEIKQSSDALSAHWDENNNYIYPQVGDFYLNVKSDYGRRVNGEYGIIYYYDLIPFYDSSDKYDGYFHDYYDYDTVMSWLTNSEFYSEYQSGLFNTLKVYKDMLELSDIEVRKIDIITLDEINSVVKKNNKKIPYAEWKSLAISDRTNSSHLEFAFLNDYLTSEQRFLYNTTYWIRSGYNTSPHPSLESPEFARNEYVLFVDSNGGICEGGFTVNGRTSICGTDYNSYISKLGCGIRPVITISNELEYLIKTEIDDNGKIEVVKNSLGGETIQFKISANKGYKLGSIVIKTDSGEEVEFSKGEITKNDDGSFSLDKNKFTMPFENVTIQAKFELENILKNPETGAKLLFIILILVASIGIGTFIYKKKESRYNI